MKKLLKRPLSVVLAVLMAVSGIVFSVNAAESKTDASEKNPYGLTENMRDGVILHAWCWSFDTIRENLPKIAEAGYTSVQTSPINECKVGDNGGMDLMGNGKWYYHYQPTLYTIGNYQLGSLEQFKAMCSEAEKYGIHIIVDVVANHCSSDYNAISSEVKNIPGGAFHDGFGIGDYNNRYQCTQGQLLNLYDLNTQNPNVQQMILNYLKSCVAAGADGFRYDAAKHIELPDDAPDNGRDFASDFWPVVLNNGSEFQYGEILQDNGSRTSSYSEYMSVTASSYGSVIREAAKSGNFNADNLRSYRSDGAADERLVSWVESHDNYTGDGSWSQLDNQDIRQAWAVIAARGETTPLFFNRPDGSSTTDQWGKNKIGIAGDDNYCHPEVVAVNQFRNAMVGLPDKISNPTDSNSLLMIERGSAGAVVINASESDVTLNCATDVADGTYTDQAFGGKFTVSGGKLSGTVQAGAVAVIYNSDLVKQPTVSISQDGGEFRGALTLTLSARNTTESTYKIGSGSPVQYESGDKITIGADMADNTSVDIILYGKNDDGEVTKTYTFTKIPAPHLDGETVVYFDNNEYNWDEVYIYAYYRNNNNNVINNRDWPGVKMTDLGGGMYGYVLDKSWDSAYVIFNNNKGTQYPTNEGYTVKRGDSKIFNGSGLDDYIVTPPVTVPDTTVPPVTDPEIQKGDADRSGFIDVKDVTLIQKHICGIKNDDGTPLIDESNPENMRIADVNGDNFINVIDVTLIQKIIAKII